MTELRPAKWLREAFRIHLLTLVASQGLLYLLPLVAVPYMLRVLGDGGFGRVAFVMGIAQYFVFLTDYGFQLSASRRAALMRDDAEALAGLLASVSLIRLALCAVGALVAAVACMTLAALGQDAAIFWLSYLTVVGNALLPAWFLQGVGRLQAAILCSVCGQAVALAGLILWVRGPADYPWAVLCQAGAAPVAALLAWVFLAGSGQARLRWPNLSQLAQAWKEGWPLFVSTAATHMYTTSNVVLLGLVAPPAAVGQFAAADKIVRGAQGLIAPVSQALYPHVARLAAESGSVAVAFLRRMLRWQTGVMLLVSVGLFGAADDLAAWLYGSSVSETTAALRWLALLPMLVGISNVFGIQTMLNFGLKQSFNRILLFSGVVNMPLVVLWGRQHGAMGAAAAVLVTEAIVVLLLAMRLQRVGLLRLLLAREES